jgi:hypothetical protein
MLVSGGMEGEEYVPENWSVGDTLGQANSINCTFIKVSFPGTTYLMSLSRQFCKTFNKMMPRRLPAPASSQSSPKLSTRSMLELNKNVGGRRNQEFI